MSEIESYQEPKTVDQIETLDEAKARIIELEDALMPVAQIAISMTNAGMMLQALNRDDPPGGYWLSGRDQIKMVPAFPLFSMALMRFGFGRALTHFQDTVNAIQQHTHDVEAAQKQLTDGATRS